jgi:UDP-glucose 4-epimerase
VVHHAFIRHFRAEPRVRHEVNVLGTKRLLEYCVAYGVKRVVVLSSSYVYGALPDNPYYVDEEYPLNVSRTYPEVRDLAEVDTLCSAFLWRHPEVTNTILRPVATLGPSVSSTMARYLRQSYDPMIMRLRSHDAVHPRGRRGRSGRRLPRAPGRTASTTSSDPAPCRSPSRCARPAAPRCRFRAARATGVRPALPARALPTPPGAIDFVKYPCTLDGRRFVAATGFRPRFSLEEIFASVRR